MSAAHTGLRPQLAVPSEDTIVDTTLLELVWAVREVTDDEREVIATVLSLLRSGRVRLRGIFRGTRLECP